ncbi:MAG: ribosomal protein S5 [uncultured bacterium]|nr:MAG: ribosomal protein S5 [uncultured bacterium]
MSEEIIEDNYFEKVVHVNRCAKVVAGGRRFSFSALCVVGNKGGKVGIGFGKANEVSDAIRKGVDQAKKNMVNVVKYGSTIPHEVMASQSGGKVLLKPAGPGTGIKAGFCVKAVLEAAGITDVLSKSLGSNNKINVTKATLKCLLQLKTADQIFALRKRS